MVLARRAVRLSPKDGERLGPVVVVRTAGDRDRLLELLDDDRARERVSAVDLSARSLVVLTAVEHSPSTGEESCWTVASSPRNPSRSCACSCRTGARSTKTGTVLVLDRLADAPAEVMLDGRQPDGPGHAMVLPVYQF